MFLCCYSGGKLLFAEFLPARCGNVLSTPMSDL